MNHQIARLFLHLDIFLFGYTIFDKSYRIRKSKFKLLQGLKSINDKEGYFFGKFIYDNCASPIQNFPMKKKSNELYEIVELRIHSNSGNPNYTCLYRVRVHGEINL